MITTISLRPLLTQLNSFLNGQANSQWLHQNEISVYFKKSTRIIDGQKYRNCIDIASVSVLEKYQKRGLFTNLLLELKRAYPTNVLYVESVMNPHLRNCLTRHGFKIIREQYGSYDACLIPTETIKLVLRPDQI